MEEQVQQEKEMRKQLSRLEVIGAVLTVGVLDFWFEIGATLGSKMVNSLEELISR